MAGDGSIPEPNTNIVQAWSDGDDAGGAIAAVQFLGGSGEVHTRVYYSGHGSIQELNIH